MTRADHPTDVTEPPGGALTAQSRERAVGALLRIPRLRKLWAAQFLGGIADRLALLVLILLAVQAAPRSELFGDGYRALGFAVAAVLGSRILAVLLCGVLLHGPLFALFGPRGRLDRRWAMIGCDGLRVVMLIAAPLWIDWMNSSALAFVLATAFVTGVVERIWATAKNTTAPALLPTAAPLLVAPEALRGALAETTSGVATPATTHSAVSPGSSATLRLGKADGRPEPSSPDVPAAGERQAPGVADTLTGQRLGAGSAAPAAGRGTTAGPMPEHLDALHRLDLRTAYAALPMAAVALFAVTSISNLVAVAVGWFHTHQAALASDASAGLFAASIATLYLAEFPRAIGSRPRSPLAALRRPRQFLPGRGGKGRTGAVPLLVGSIAGVTAALTAALALAVLLAADLDGGPVAFSLLVLALTAGSMAGVRLAPRALAGLSRRRMFALSLALTGLALLVAGIVPDPATVLLLALVAGFGFGVAAHTAHRLLDQEAEEAQRPRVTEHLHAVVGVFAMVAAVGAPLVAAVIGPHRLEKGSFTFAHGGAAFTLMLAGALLLPVAAIVLGRMDDRRGTPLRRDLRYALLGGPEPEQHAAGSGYFIALEGGDGAGKTTQVEQLAEWIRGKGHEVVVTREPGATAIGKRLRSILLDVSSTGISHRAEALLYAADRAEHVDSLIRPALARGAVVISDRYIDSSIAYQGAGRDLSPTEIARISRWATAGLVPHLTVLLDIAPEAARERFTEAPDRMESEPAEFHERVRGGFLALAAADPSRYLVVDAARSPEAVAMIIRHRLDRELPLSEQEIRAREEAERKAAEEARRKAEEEARRKAEEERLERERQEQLARLREEEEARKRAELEEAKRREAERQAEEARRRAAEVRRLAEEEARRRAEEDEARRREEERARRLAEEEERLRRETDARRTEKQRKAEEALLRAEEVRRRAEAAAALARDAETVQTPAVSHPGAESPAGSGTGTDAAGLTPTRQAPPDQPSDDSTRSRPGNGSADTDPGGDHADTEQLNPAAPPTRRDDREGDDSSAPEGGSAAGGRSASADPPVSDDSPDSRSLTGQKPQADPLSPGPTQDDDEWAPRRDRPRPMGQADPEPPQLGSAEGSLADSPGADALTVQTPMVSPQVVSSDDVTQTVQSPRPGFANTEETRVLPQVGDLEETRQLPLGRGGSESGPGPADLPPRGADQRRDPADRVPSWLWRAEPEPSQDSPDTVERTREMPQIGAQGRDPAAAEPWPTLGEPRPTAHTSPSGDTAEPSGTQEPRGARPGYPQRPSRSSRPRSDWAEETPLDDLPTLADELLGPFNDPDDESR